MSHPEQIGDYRILGLIGQGGMGAVYEARQPGAERSVALKLITSKTPSARARFAREGELLARISHPNVVGVHDLGESSLGPYLVTDWVQGESLREAHEGGGLDPRRAAEVVRDLAGAVAALHAVGVVHRDIKPENVLLRASDGRPMLIDFGLAFSDELERLTRTGAWVGTPQFIAPEQMGGMGFDERVDVYGLGATLYALLSGDAPFMTATSLATLMVAVASQAPDWSMLRHVDKPLVTITARCMAKSPDSRYASAALLREDLERFLAGEPISGGRALSLPMLVVGAVVALVVGLALVFSLSPRRAQPTVRPGPIAVVTSSETTRTPTDGGGASRGVAEWRRVYSVDASNELPAGRGNTWFLDDGQVAISMADSGIHLWDPPTAALTQVVRFPRGSAIWTVGFGRARSGEWQAVAGLKESLVVVPIPPSGEAQRSFPMAIRPRSAFVIPGEDQAWVGDDEGWLQKIDLRSGEVLARFRHDSGNFVSNVAVSEQHLVSTSGGTRGGSVEFKVRVFRRADLEPYGDPVEMFGAIEALGLSRDGALGAAGANSGRVFVFQLSPPRSPRALAGKGVKSDSWVATGFGGGAETPFAHRGSVRSCEFSPDGRYLYTASSGGGSGKSVLCVWDVASGEPLASHTLTSVCSMLRVSDDGRRLAIAFSGGQFELWEPAE